MKKEFNVKVTEDFTVYNNTKSKVLSQMIEGDELTAKLNEDTEEYFVHDSVFNFEVLAAQYDFHGNLHVEEGFEIL